MADNKISFRYTSIKKDVGKRLSDKVNGILKTEFQLALQKLVNDSPVGSSESQGKPSLKNSWYIRYAGNKTDLIIKIGNTAPFALNRLEGRNAGKQPPIPALIPWVIRKLKIDKKRAYFVAKKIAEKIAREGTDRSKRSFREFDPKTGNPSKNGTIDRTIKKVKKQIAEIVITKL